LQQGDSEEVDMRTVPVARSARSAAFRPTRVTIGLVDDDRDTHRIGGLLASTLRARGFAADIMESLRLPLPHAEAVVLGSSGRRRSLTALAHFVASARAELGAVATALFVVRRMYTRDPMTDIRRAIDRLHWRPDLAAALDANEPHHGAVLRWMIDHVMPHREWSVASATDAVRLADSIAVGLARADELHVLARGV
jgi:menaquinone-dependent protoporphyrinogen IX oxidase